MTLSIDRDRPSPLYANGETIVYTVVVSNTGRDACEVRGVNIDVTFPGPTGAANGTKTRVNIGARYPANTAPLVIATLPHKLALNPGVTSTQALVSMDDGLLQDRIGALDPFDLSKTVSTDIVGPKITIDKKGSIEIGVGPQNVTYTYDVRNTSPIPIPLKNVAVKDDLCTTPTYVSGDGGDGLLTVGEVFVFSCTMLHQAPGVFVNTARACAIDALDDREVCSEPDTWTVVLTSPPPPVSAAAQGAVKPANVVQAPCTLSTPSGLRVRAGELTTIRVRVRNVDAGTVARIALPGGKVVREPTNAQGVATFRVRPTRSGTATIRVAECSDIERLTVRRARQVASRRVPRVTG